jgi:hypothetical protein
MIKKFFNDIRTKVAEAITPKREYTKQEQFLKLLQEHIVVSVAVHIHAKGVVLPDSLLSLPEADLPVVVVLQYGNNLATPIKDLVTGSDGISATLSFSRKPFKTFIPWDAVLGMKGDVPPPVGPNNGGGNFVVLKGEKVDNEEVSNDVGKRLAVA